MTTTTTTLPLATGSWAFDPNHSGVSFKVRHLGLTNVRGRFNGVDAWLEVGEDLPSTRFGATIDIATIDTNQADRDAHLLSTDFFSAEQHPTMTFASTAIRDLGSEEYEADGDLTIMGVTRPVSLNVTSFRCIQHPVNKRDLCGADASVAIKRSEWGIKRGATGIGDDVKISIQIEAHKE